MSTAVSAAGSAVLSAALSVALLCSTSAQAQPAGPRADEPLRPAAVRLPPPTRLDYDLRRGYLSGRAVLSWQPQGARYELSLQGTVLGLAAMTWTSRGSLDERGLAPQRFADKRLNRDERVASFDAAAGRIHYSDGAPAAAWLPGAQDRLSWMVQLPAILEATPALRAPGSRIAMWVSGARGDADLWTFVVKGRESLNLPAGRVAQALRVSRAPRKPQDTQAEAWLDPARGHLPVRALLSTPDSDSVTEFSLR